MKIIKKQYLTAFFLCFSLNLGVAQAGAFDVAGADKFAGSDCISIRTIRDYTALDDRSLLIRGTGDKVYLVSLLQPSFELKSSIGVGFASMDGRLCPLGGDRIILDGLARDEVRIRSIDRISQAKENEILVRFGLKGPAEHQVPAPKAVKGAEIEELG